MPQTTEPADREESPTPGEGEPRPVLHGPADHDAVMAWVGSTLHSLGERLERLRAELRGRQAEATRAALARAIDRLHMLQIVEHALAVGEAAHVVGFEPAAASQGGGGACHRCTKRTVTANIGCMPSSVHSG